MAPRRTVVRDIELEQISSVSELLAAQQLAGGFTGRHLGEAADVLERMWRARGCVTFLAFPAAVMATGLRGVLRTLVERGLIDLIITTCGTLDHDLARSWGTYYHGHWDLDDAALRQEGLNRLGNVVVPDSSYGVLLERKLQPLLEQWYEQGTRTLSTIELCRKLGEAVDSETSLLTAASKRGVDIVVPGITDGAVGSQLWMFRQRHRDFSIDVLEDEEALSRRVFGVSTSGALIIGGGISKHHTIWWNQFKDGLDYTVYLSTGMEHDGSLTGARVKEAISWGKVKASGRSAHVDGEATALLPYLIWGVLQRLQERPPRRLRAPTGRARKTRASKKRR